MKLRHALELTAFCLSLLMVTVSLSLEAQAPDYVARLKELNLATINGKVPTYYVAGHREPAEELKRRIEDCNAFFEQTLGVQAAVTLAVLDGDGWSAALGRPYSLPFIDGMPPVIFMPATSGSPAFQLMMARKNNIPEDLLLAFLTERRITFETVADQFVNLIGFHELGHVLSGNFGIPPTNRWLDEFLASYWSYAYISERQPEWKSVFDLLGRPSAARPKNTSLEDFERLYSKVDDYGWYQGTFETRIREIHPKLGLDFLIDVKKEFPRSTNTGTTPAMTPRQVLQRLERIAPGFEAWSATFN